MLGELVIEPGARRAEYAKRSRPYDEATFEKPLQELRETEGWTIQRENKASIRMRHPKAFDEILENRFWNVLYRFGYPDLNSGRKFRVKVGSGSDGTEKQIDVFAKDDETVVVAECKACELPTKRSLLKDLNEFTGLKKPIADAIREHYGIAFKPKIIWCFVTDNVRWSQEDLKRAHENNIKVIRELELLYFEEFSKKIGPAARYQFHAEYLEDQTVPALAGRKVPAVKTKLGGTTAYMFSALAKDILRIAFVNHRDLRDPSGAPSYQRIVKPTRLKQIGAFLDDRGFFPNTILLNFHKAPRFEQVARDETSGVVFGNLILPDKYKSCWVIDGQHRLYGTAFASEEYKAPLFFIAFDKISPAAEANIFVDINAKQATVPTTLLSALDGEVKWDSDDPKERLAAIASRAVDLLNSRGNGALEGKVVSPGITAGTSQPLNLRSIQERIGLSELVGSVSPKTGDIIPGPCWAGTSQASLMRLVSLLNEHFEAVRLANPERWEAGRLGSLCTNLGVGSHIRLLAELIHHVSYRDRIKPSEMDVEDLYAKIRPIVSKLLDYTRSASDEEFKARFTVIFGSSGYHQYFFKLFELIEESTPGFRPEGYDEYRRVTSQEVTDSADKNVKWIQAVVPDYVKHVLRLKFGDNFFDIIVPKEVQKACLLRRVDDDDDARLQPEGYLDWIHYQKIIMQKEVRDEVKDVLSIRLPNDNGGKHFFSDWFDQINVIRRVAAHPSSRSYKPKDIEIIAIVVDHLRSNLPPAFGGTVDAPVS